MSVGLATALTKLDPQIWDMYDDCIPKKSPTLDGREHSGLMVSLTAHSKQYWCKVRPTQLDPSLHPHSDTKSLQASQPPQLLLQHTVVTLVDHHACLPPPTPSRSEMASCARSAQRSRGCAHLRFICLNPTQMCSGSLRAMWQ